MPPRQLWTVEDGVLTANLHPGQARAWESERRFVVILAGTQGGKTSFGPLWVHREIQAKGPGDYLAVTASFPLLELKMLPEFLRLFRDTLRLGEWKETKHAFIFTEEGCRRMWGYVPEAETRVIFGSAANPDSLESATAKAAWLDEAGQDKFTYGAYEAVLRRVSLHRGRILITTTPYNLGWLKQRLFEPWRKGDADIDVVQFKSTQNPSFSQEEYDWAKANLPDHRFRLFYDAEFARPAGMIYASFVDLPREDGGCLVKPFDIPWGWERHVGVDFGAVNNACVWVARDPARDEFYVYRVVHVNGMTTEEKALQALRLSVREPEASWWGGAPSEVQQREDWAAYGVPVEEPPFKDVEAGIDRVTGLLKTGRLFVVDSLDGLREEFLDYKREADDTGEVTEKIAAKEKYHRLDALRYAIVGATDGCYLQPASSHIARLFGFARNRWAA